jgi:hypothetical protein
MQGGFTLLFIINSRQVDIIVHVQVRGNYDRIFSISLEVFLSHQASIYAYSIFVEQIKLV